jgi:hypothetical protein
MGKVKGVHRAGMVPDVDDDVPCTRADPGLRLNVYKAMGDGHRETSHHVGVKTTHCEKTDELRPPKRAAAKALRDAVPLPPLRGRSDAEVKAEQLARLRKELPLAFQRAQDRALGAV